MSALPNPGLREGAIFDRHTIHEIQRAAREGIYDIRGFGAKRRVPHFDDLVFLGASVSRYPLEGYRERCDTDVVLVPMAVAARPSASLAWAPSAPKLMPAMVIGIASWIGLDANRVPIVTSVAHFSR